MWTRLARWAEHALALVTLWRLARVLRRVGGAPQARSSRSTSPGWVALGADAGRCGRGQDRARRGRAAGTRTGSVARFWVGLCDKRARRQDRGGDQEVHAAAH